MDKQQGWRSVTKPLRARKSGALILVMGPAKIGKSVATGSLYKVIKNRDILYINSGEGNGWQPLLEHYRVEPDLSLELEDFFFDNRPRPIPTFWRWLEAVRRDPPRAIIFDSIDGFAALVERELTVADSRCVDKNTGVRNLNIRGYGLKLNVIRTLIRSYLMPLSAGGVHVLATCGVEAHVLRSGDDHARDTTILVPSIGGKGSLEIPRLFSDVCLVRASRDGGRELAFWEKRGDSVLGSRLGLPDLIDATSLGDAIADRFGSEPPDPGASDDGPPVINEAEKPDTEPWDEPGQPSAPSAPSKDKAQEETRLERKRSERRERIIRKALELFADVGEDAFTMAELAERLDYVPSTLYKYFPSKESLLETIAPLIEKPRRSSWDKDALEAVPAVYKLEAGDIGVSTSLKAAGARHIDTDPRENGSWQHAAIAIAQKRTSAGEELRPFDRLLANLAYAITKARNISDILKLCTEHKLTPTDYMRTVGIEDGVAIDKLNVDQLAEVKKIIQRTVNQGTEPERCASCGEVIAPDEIVVWTAIGDLIHEAHAHGQARPLTIPGMIEAHFERITNPDEVHTERLALASRSGVTAADLYPTDSATAQALALAIKEREDFIECFDGPASPSGALWSLHTELGAYAPEGRMERLRNLFKQATYRWRRHPTVHDALKALSNERVIALAELVRKAEV